MSTIKWLCCDECKGIKQVKGNYEDTGFRYLNSRDLCPICAEAYKFWLGKKDRYMVLVVTRHAYFKTIWKGQGSLPHIPSRIRDVENDTVHFHPGYTTKGKPKVNIMTMSYKEWRLMTGIKFEVGVETLVFAYHMLRAYRRPFVEVTRRSSGRGRNARYDNVKVNVVTSHMGRRPFKEGYVGSICYPGFQNDLKFPLLRKKTVRLKFVQLPSIKEAL